ncbi:GNAT family N-acetyltransferase [Paucibacter aquatile]|jgi:putative acetyltransferase|uniref:GNAT family N-acetyltransferase n=1 Tax=Kinneretia aquatilis TaxID=2070761 RepID=A0A2N8KVA8_9BURK|nr:MULTISPECIES: GNAT family N-acetyltransferase [Roseateles]PND37397.1 GNAT family N-acetyltransferase [Paucibacter aquatile]
MEKITIRRSQVSDAAAMAQLMSHPEVFSGLLQLPYPSEELWRARLQDNAVPGKTDLSLVAEVQGQVLGSAGLHPAGASLRRRHAMGLGISVAAEAQGQGIGRALMAALMDYADNWGQVLRTELTVYADNARAIRLYESFGFQREGLMRAYALRNGVYVDTLAMARLHPNPPRWN